jgi:hypothetical protein
MREIARERVRERERVIEGEREKKRQFLLVSIIVYIGKEGVFNFIS